MVSSPSIYAGVFRFAKQLPVKRTTDTCTPLSSMDAAYSIFFPNIQYSLDRQQAIGGRYAYYTTADVAVSILKHRQLWMRNTAMMNDFMEFKHGFECLKSVWSEGGPGEHFNSVLDKCFPGMAAEVNALFGQWIPAIQADSYITCMSEHPPEEDTHGRLSMWRAYGGKNGVALVFKPDLLTTPLNIGVFTSPVMYVTQEMYRAHVGYIAARMESALDLLRSEGRDKLRNLVFHMYRLSVLATKHPGFREEREWRAVASLGMNLSPILHSDVEIVRGTPQTVYKLSLQNVPEKGVVGLDLAELLDRIIIGPCDFPEAMRQAFMQLMLKAGISDPDKKIVVSDIPLRHL